MDTTQEAVDAALDLRVACGSVSTALLGGDPSHNPAVQRLSGAEHGRSRRERRVMRVPVQVDVRPLLTGGGIGINKNTGGVYICISEEATPERARETAWHEVVHMLRAIGNPELPVTARALKREEKLVEDAAVKLAAACPEILEWLGIAHRFQSRISEGAERAGESAPDGTRAESPNAEASDAGKEPS